MMAGKIPSGSLPERVYEMKVMSHEDESLTGEFQDKVRLLKRRYVKILMDLIGELRSRNGDKGMNLRVVTFSLFGMMNWIYTWYHPKRDLALADLIDQMLRIYFFGILRGAEALRISWSPSWLTPSWAFCNYRYY